MSHPPSPPESSYTQATNGATGATPSEPTPETLGMPGGPTPKAPTPAPGASQIRDELLAVCTELKENVAALTKHNTDVRSLLSDFGTRIINRWTAYQNRAERLKSGRINPAQEEIKIQAATARANQQLSEVGTAITASDQRKFDLAQLIQTLTVELQEREATLATICAGLSNTNFESSRQGETSRWNNVVSNYTKVKEAEHHIQSDTHAYLAEALILTDQREEFIHTREKARQAHRDTLAAFSQKLSDETPKSSAQDERAAGSSGSSGSSGAGVDENARTSSKKKTKSELTPSGRSRKHADKGVEYPEAILHKLQSSGVLFLQNTFGLSSDSDAAYLVGVDKKISRRFNKSVRPSYQPKPDDPPIQVPDPAKPILHFPVCKDNAWNETTHHHLLDSFIEYVKKAVPECPDPCPKALSAILWARYHRLNTFWRAFQRKRGKSSKQAVRRYQKWVLVTGKEKRMNSRRQGKYKRRIKQVKAVLLSNADAPQGSEYRTLLKNILATLRHLGYDGQSDEESDEEGFNTVRPLRLPWRHETVLQHVIIANGLKRRHRHLFSRKGAKLQHRNRQHDLVDTRPPPIELPISIFRADWLAAEDPNVVQRNIKPNRESQYKPRVPDHRRMKEERKQFRSGKSSESSNPKPRRKASSKKRSNREA